jgi:hypothetical protein
MLAALTEEHGEFVAAQARQCGCDAEDVDDLVDAFFAMLVDGRHFTGPPNDPSRLLVLAAMGELPEGGYPELARLIGLTEDEVKVEVERLKDACRDPAHVARPRRPL